MIKFIAATVWICMVTLGAVFYSFQSAGAKSDEAEAASPLMGGLDYVKTEVISIPVIRKSTIDGYFLTRLVYTVDPAKLAKLSVPAETLMVDQVYSYLYGNPLIDFSQHDSLDLDAFKSGIRDSINKRVGDTLVSEVMIEQIDFLSKDEIRDNALRRRTGSPASPAAAKPFKEH
jgi:hypothetical protein